MRVHTADLTLRISDLFAKGLSQRAEIINLFDAHIAYPAPVVKDPDGNPVYTCEKDYPRSGRNAGWFFPASFKAISGKEHLSDLTTFQKLSNLSDD